MVRKKARSIGIIVLIMILVIPIIYMHTQTPEQTDQMRQISENKTPSGNFTLPTEDDGITIEDDAQGTDIQIEDMDDTGSETISINDDQEDDIQIEDIEDDSETQDIQIEDPDAEKDNRQDRTDMLDQNFESQELIVKTDNIRELDEDRIISQCDDVYVLKFQNKASAERAYSVYYEQDNDFVAPNINLSIQTDDTDIELADSYEKPESTGSALEILETELKDIEPIKAKNNMIAVIDTGVRSSDDQIIEKISMLGDDGSDDNGHGTEMIQTISDADPNAKIISIKALDSSGYGDVTSIYSAIKYAIEKKVDIINLSIAGYSIAENQAITAIINEAIENNIQVVGAAGNYNSDVKNFIPGNIENVHVIGAADNNGSKLGSSNYGATVDYYVVASTTSQATARFTGNLSRENGDMNVIQQQADQPNSWLYTLRSEDIKIEDPDDISDDISIETTEQETIEQGFNTQNYTIKKNGIDNVPTFDYSIIRSRLQLDSANVKASGGSPFQYMTDSYGNPSIGFKFANSPFTADIKGSWEPHDCHGYGLTGVERQFDGSIAIRFPKSVEYGKTGEYYDLIVTLSNINVYIRLWDEIKKGVIILMDTGNAIHFKAGPWDRDADASDNYVGVRMDVNYKVYKAGTNTLGPDGKVMFTWKDLDTNNAHGEYDGKINEYQESIRLLSGVCNNTVYTQANPLLEIINSDKPAFLSKQATSTSTAIARAGLSVLGDSSGTKIRWEGSECSTFMTSAGFDTVTITASRSGPGTITPSGKTTINKGGNKYYKMKPNTGAYISSIKITTATSTATNTYTKDNQPATDGYAFINVKTDQKIHVVFATLPTPKPTVTPAPTKPPVVKPPEDPRKQIDTYIRYQDVNGIYGAGDLADSQLIEENGSYSYTYARSWEPAEIYGDPGDPTINVDPVTDDGTYYIYVPRKRYTYSFDHNLPAGHDESEISDKQPGFTKYAGSGSDDVTEPSITGFTFNGWNEQPDGSGEEYIPGEEMLSNKTFYAIWEPIVYYVRYDPNEYSEPDKLEGEFTQNYVNTASGMPDSTFTYGEYGTLRQNDFTRSGYDFIGWNTDPNGNGAAFPNTPYDMGDMYSDGYSRIYNLTTEPYDTFTLYAQWRKKLGTETLTVISEETGNPVPNTYFRLYKQVNGSWQSVPGMEVQKTNSNGQITVNDLHWFNYEWRATEVPTGYQTPNNLDFMITHNRLRSNDTIILYMIRTNIIIRSEVSDIIRGENPPAFMYHISGYDVAGMKHEYNILVNTAITTKSGEKTLANVFAGQYDVTQKPISRYNPQNPHNIVNGSINGINAHVTPFTINGSSVTFPYTIKQYGGFGSMDNIDNKINK